MRGANYKILPSDPIALQPQQVFSTPAIGAAASHFGVLGMTDLAPKRRSGQPFN
jgi:hypothetical protein